MEMAGDVQRAPQCGIWGDFVKLPQMAFIGVAALSLLFLAFAMYPKPEEKPVVFFAYGSNLEISTMRARAGGAENATPAILHGYRLVFQTNRDSEFGVANAIPDQTSSVAGAIYVLAPEQAKMLDKGSGGPDFYQKISITAEQRGGATLIAVTHVLSGTPSFAPPSRPIVLALSKGLQQFGYNQSEQDKIAAAASEAQQKSGRGS